MLEMYHVRTCWRESLTVFIESYHVPTLPVSSLSHDWSDSISTQVLFFKYLLVLMWSFFLSVVSLKHCCIFYFGPSI